MSFRKPLLSLVAMVAVLGGVSLVQAAEITGDYLEVRTCDIYTGPCFANSEIGLAGREAIMAWSIERGSHGGVDLAGLKVVMAISASDTLGWGGGLVCHPEPIKSVILVDERGTPAQREALVEFARRHADRACGDVVRVDALPIEASFDHVSMIGRLKAGNEAEVLTRQLGKGDCVCTNELTFYPPMTKVDNSAPAFSLASRFSGKGLGVRWANPNTRTAFLATFAY